MNEVFKQGPANNCQYVLSWTNLQQGLANHCQYVLFVLYKWICNKTLQNKLSILQQIQKSIRWKLLVLANDKSGIKMLSKSDLLLTYFTRDFWQSREVIFQPVRNLSIEDLIFKAFLFLICHFLALTISSDTFLNLLQDWQFVLQDFIADSHVQDKQNILTVVCRTLIEDSSKRKHTDSCL